MSKGVFVNQDWNKVSRCRFIFAYTDVSDEEKHGDFVLH